MAKANNKTSQNSASPKAFIKGVENDTRRTDAEFLLMWFSEVTGLIPKMWGPSIIGYGRYHYKYDSGREGDAVLTGFSPRKSNLAIYVMPGFEIGDIPKKLKCLGKHKITKSCLYVNKLADVDLNVLAEVVQESIEIMKARYETWDV